MNPKKYLLAGIMASVLAVTGLVGTSDTVGAQTTFNPTLEVTVADPTPETAADYTLQFGLPIGDVNFGGVVGFIPPDWGIVDGRDVPVGAVVGSLRADATLGLINSACFQVLPVEFEMLNASLDVGDSIDFDAEDEGDPTTADWAEDIDDNGLIQAVDQWPDFIFRTLEDVTEDPIRRAAGLAIIAGTPVLLQYVVFPPGTFINENIPNDKELGYPSVTLLQNAGDPDIVPAPSPINDFCTPLASTNTSFGVTQDNEFTEDIDESGIPLFINPKDGTYTFTVASAGLRDADGDGYENSLDTCPFDANIGDPRVSNDGDLDGDGLDAACDSNDNPSTGGINSDEDLDGYQNRNDNCPLVANGEDTTNQADADEDQIGDVCDPNPDNADTEGDLKLDATSFDVVIGAGGAGPGGPPACPDPGCWSASDTPNETDDPDDGPTDGDDDGGSDTGLIIGIIVGIVAAVAIIGGGAAMMMRKGDGAA